MDNVFIAKLNENTLKMTPTDVMAHKYSTCARTHSDSHTHATFRHTSLGAAGSVAA